MAGSAQAVGTEESVRRYQLFINGRFVDSQSGKTFESINPHDCTVVAVVAEGDQADVDAAVQAARAAFDGSWSAMPPTDRAKILLKIADLLDADLKRAHRFAKRLQAGTVWINTCHMIETNSPFGGYKLSGYGRENGMAMVEHLTKLKQVWVDLNDFTMDFFGM